MTYTETIDYLYNHFPAFSHVGASALKVGLGNSQELDKWLGHPHRAYKTIHVAGTNGKGSTSHTIASILMSCGYHVGLYTSPHLVDFRERIRVDGKMIEEQKVIDFVERTKRDMPSTIEPSFFEITMMMAFDYFRERKVDVAVIEVGLGGRMDSTNIITPDMCVITNIGLEHTLILGDTLGKIAGEKAGIMKRGVPVAIGERHPETDPVFISKANEAGSPIYFAEDTFKVKNAEEHNGMLSVKMTKTTADGYQEEDALTYGLSGYCQQKNIVTVMKAVEVLKDNGYKITYNGIHSGLKKVVIQTGIMGRWQKISSKPDMIIDTGHNAHGVKLLAQQLANAKYPKKHIVWGMANDKHPENVMPLMPKDAIYYYTRANVERAMSETEMEEIGRKSRLNGKAYHNVKDAIEAAKKNAQPNDLIFIGGSNFVVGEVL